MSETEKVFGIEVVPNRKLVPPRLDTTARKTIFADVIDDGEQHKISVGFAYDSEVSNGTIPFGGEFVLRFRGGDTSYRFDADSGRLLETITE